MSVPSPEERPSPDQPEDAVAAVLRSLSVSAARANLARSAVIAEAVSAAEAGELLEPQRAAAVDAAHQVVGSAGTFGSPLASRTASRLEDYFTGVGPVRAGVVPDGVHQARLQLDELTMLLATGSPGRLEAQTDDE